MRFGIQASRERIMVRKGHTGEAGQHVLWRDTLLYKLTERRRNIAVQEIGAKAVERYKDRSGRE